MNGNGANCGRDHCGACCGGSCSGCGGALQLTQEELDLLRCLAQLAFLPVARRWDAEEPVCLEADTGVPEDLRAQVIVSLERKGLIALDYHLPLTNFDYSAYGAYPAQGSMALTAAGQQVVEQLEIQGIED